MNDQLLLSYKILMQRSALAVQKGFDELRVSPRRARINNPIAVEESFTILAKNLYQRECQQCHAETGKADSPVAAASNKSVADLVSSEVLQQSDGVIRYRLYDHTVRLP